MIETAMSYSPGLTLLIAPPAWGKTQLLKKLFANKEDSFIFVSPLRALANEFYENIKNQFKVLNIERMVDWNKFNQEHQIIIVTPELVSEYQLNRLGQRTIVLDEFHLYFYWGTSFREEMWRAMIDICIYSKRILALTATLSTEHYQFMHQQFLNFDYPITIINVGNQKLKNFPNKITYLKKRQRNTWKYFVLPEPQQTILIFCRYRSEVSQLEGFYQKQGLNILSCIGGEASSFTEKLKLNPNPQIILATTVLSHGVNLPSISKIIFTYEVNNQDFWIQMVGRGGRKGESFEVITYDSFMLNKWHKLRSFFTIIWSRLIYHLKW